MQWNPHACKLVQQMPGRLEHHVKNPFSKLVQQMPGRLEHHAKNPFSKLVQQMPGRLEHHAKNPFSMQSTVEASEKLSISLRTAA